MFSQNEVSPAADTHQNLSPADVVRVCRNLIFQKTNRAPTSVETAWLVEKVFNQLFPELHAWRAVTHAWSASPAAAQIFSENIDASMELRTAKLRELPKGSIRTLDADVPPEQLGTFDAEKGRHLGHVCVLLHVKYSDYYYFLDPEPWDMESRQLGIRFDDLLMFPIDAGEISTETRLPNGATVSYLLYPAVPPPNPVPDVMPVLEKCIGRVIAHFAVRDDAFMKSMMNPH